MENKHRRIQKEQKTIQKKLIEYAGLFEYECIMMIAMLCNTISRNIYI